MTGGEVEPRRSLLDAWRDNPQWRKLYLGWAISLFGDWINTLAIVHLLGNSHGSTALALAIVFVLKLLPYSLFGPIAGVLADRFDRIKILMVCNLLAMGVALMFLLARQVGSPVYVYVLTGLQISIKAFFEPARQALIPSLVAKRDLLSANTIGAGTWSIVYVLATAAGGPILVFWGWRAAFVIDALTYLVSTAYVLAVRYQAPARKPRTRPSLARLLGVEDFVAGLRYILRDPEVRRVILVKFGWGTMGAVLLFLTLLGRQPAYQFFGHADFGITYLWMCRAVGTLFGPIVARRWSGDDPLRMKRAITISFFSTISFYMLVTWVSDPYLGGLMICLAHFGGSTLWVMSTVLLMRIVPEELRGRTFAADLGLYMLTATVSQLGYAELIDSGVLDLDQVMRIAALVCLIPAVWWTRNELRRPVSESEIA